MICKTAKDGGGHSPKDCGLAMASAPKNAEFTKLRRTQRGVDKAACASYLSAFSLQAMARALIRHGLFPPKRLRLLMFCLMRGSLPAPP